MDRNDIIGSIAKHIAKHSGFTESDLSEYKCFVYCEPKPFGDASDDVLTAMVRYVNPKNESDWGYDVYVLHHTHRPSIIFWDIEMVYSTHHKLFERKCLT